MYYPPMSNLPAENLEPDHSCPLCNGKKIMPYHRDKVRDYLQCETCDLVFVPPGQHISAHEEKAYYDLHENLADGPGYRRFLGRLFTPLNARLAPNSSGLDFGCGPGRDVGYFKSLGHRPVGLDGSQIFCEMARQYSGCEILCQEFLTLDLSTAAFDAVFANASLFHVPGQELPRILTELHTCLRPGGILFSSNPRGNSEGWSGNRYGNFIEFEESSTLLRAAHFSILSHYYRPEGVPKEQQPWLAIVCKSF